MCLFVIYKLIILSLQIGKDSKYNFEKYRLHFDDLKGMIEPLFSAVGFMFLRFFIIQIIYHISVDA